MAGQRGPTYYRKYSTVTGYFLQDDADTDPRSFDYVGFCDESLEFRTLLMIV